jgi:hypothetical protein
LAKHLKAKSHKEKAMATVTKNEIGVRPKSATEWKKAKQHYITLASGMEVGVIIPNLPLMVKTGQVPSDLLDAAIGAIKKEQITPELIKEQSDFFHLLVKVMVKDPEITDEDIPELPYEDIELLVEIGTRQRDIDAIGNQIAGLHKSEDWRKFRGWDDRD